MFESAVRIAVAPRDSDKGSLWAEVPNNEADILRLNSTQKRRTTKFASRPNTGGQVRGPLNGC